MVGWSDPEGTRHRLGLIAARLLHAAGLINGGPAGTGMSDKELERLWRKLQPLAVAR